MRSWFPRRRAEPGRQIVLVSSPGAHRAMPLPPASSSMDYLKTRAPFWKKEETRSARWVEARVPTTKRRSAVYSRPMLPAREEDSAWASAAVGIGAALGAWCAGARCRDEPLVPALPWTSPRSDRRLPGRRRGPRFSEQYSVLRPSCAVRDQRASGGTTVFDFTAESVSLLTTGRYGLALAHTLATSRLDLDDGARHPASACCRAAERLRAPSRARQAADSPGSGDRPAALNALFNPTWQASVAARKVIGLDLDHGDLACSGDRGRAAPHATGKMSTRRSSPRLMC